MRQVNLESMVSGTVWALLKGPGERVAKGDAVLVVESMKMEIPHDSPEDATVLEVFFTPGEAVREGQILAVLMLT